MHLIAACKRLLACVGHPHHHGLKLAEEKILGIFEVRGWLGPMSVCAAQTEAQPGSLTYVSGHTRAMAFFAYILYCDNEGCKLPDFFEAMGKKVPVKVLKMTGAGQHIAGLKKTVVPGITTRSFTYVQLLFLAKHLHMDMKTLQETPERAFTTFRSQ